MERKESWQKRRFIHPEESSFAVSCVVHVVILSRSTLRSQSHGHSQPSRHRWSESSHERLKSGLARLMLFLVHTGSLRVTKNRRERHLACLTPSFKPHAGVIALLAFCGASADGVRTGLEFQPYSPSLTDFAQARLSNLGCSLLIEQ